jgi:polysaccharide export outer membrane protein
MSQNHPLSSGVLRLRRVASTAAVLAAATAALACATRGSYVPVEEYPVPAPDSEYRIAAGDVLAVRVWNQDSMSNAHARVRDDGKISVPFLQDVEVAGTTPNELSQRLQTKLKTYAVNPVVTVTVEEFRPLRVSVVGEVAHSGQYDLERGAGVLAAVAAAGGLTDYAHRNAIFVLRNSADGKTPVRIRFRWQALTDAEKPAATFRLRPGDMVVVE